MQKMARDEEQHHGGDMKFMLDPKGANLPSLPTTPAVRQYYGHESKVLLQTTILRRVG